MKQNDMLAYTKMKSVLMPYAEAETEQLRMAEKMPHSYSEAAMAKISDNFRQNQRQNGHAHWIRTLAASCAAVVLLTGITCAASEPIRTRIANMFLGRYEQLVTADFDAAEDDNKVVLRIPGYLPDGFKLKEKLEKADALTMHYANDAGEAVYFDRCEYTDTRKPELLWTKDAYTEEEITISGLKGIFLKPVSEDIYPAVVFTDGGCWYLIQTTLGEDQLLEIAEGLAVEKVMLLKSPAWLPAGYTERDRTQSRTWDLWISYKNAAGNSIYFRRESLSTPAVQINDTMHYDSTPVTVSGRQGVILSRRDGDSELRIRWTDDDFRYTVSGRISEADLMEIAEKVK